MIQENLKALHGEDSTAYQHSRLFGKTTKRIEVYEETGRKIYQIVSKYGIPISNPFDSLSQAIDEILAQL